VCGVDPYAFTWGELASMLEHRERSEWGRTSSILAFIHNAFAKQPKEPREFDPYERADEAERVRNQPFDINQFRALLPPDAKERNPEP